MPIDRFLLFYFINFLLFFVRHIPFYSEKLTIIKLYYYDLTEYS